MSKGGRYGSRRQSRFINKKQQIRFALELAVYALLLPLFFLAVSLAGPIAGLILGRNTAGPLVNTVLAFCLDRWWALLIALAFVVSFSILFSHRIFGPMRSFENALRQKQLHPTKPVNCTLRSDDYFHEFSQHLEGYLNDSQSFENPEQIMEEELAEVFQNPQTGYDTSESSP